jgi:hypothetical protein
MLRYEVHAQVGGKIAQLGARLVDATAKQMADSFFDRFSAQVAPPTPEPSLAEPSDYVPRPVVPAPAHPPAIGILALIPSEPLGMPLVAWIGGAIYLFMLVLILGSML